MLLIPSYLLPKLLKRFPLVVLVFYSANTFAYSSFEAEENIDEVEILHVTPVLNLATSKLDDCNKILLKRIQLFPQVNTAIKAGYITTEFKKLYILFSQLMLDQSPLNANLDHNTFNNTKIKNNIFNAKYNKYIDRTSTYNGLGIHYYHHYLCNYCVPLNNQNMLEYCKIILQKVSFDRILLEKEFYKSFNFLSDTEKIPFLEWTELTFQLTI